MDFKVIKESDAKTGRKRSYAGKHEKLCAAVGKLRVGQAIEVPLNGEKIAKLHNTIRVSLCYRYGRSAFAVRRGQNCVYIFRSSPD